MGMKMLDCFWDRGLEKCTSEHYLSLIPIFNELSEKICKDIFRLRYDGDANKHEMYTI